MTGPIPTVDTMDWAAWQPAGHATLLFVIRNAQVLLIRKKRGLGSGLYNAPGGKVDAGEQPLEAAIREFREEVLAEPLGVEAVGEVLFHVVDGHSLRIHVFRATGCDGTPRETAEAVPYWFPVTDVPYESMWPDDRHWFLHVVDGTRFEARTIFTGDDLVSVGVTVYG